MDVRRGRSVVRPSMSPQRSFLTRVMISPLTAGHSVSSCLSFLQEGRWPPSHNGTFYSTVHS